MMEGTVAHEYMAPCEAGEDTVAVAPGYAANVEVASANPRPVPPGEEIGAPEEIETPGLRTIAEVAGALGVEPGNLVKSVPVVTDAGDFVLVLVRGDHQVNEIKLTNSLGIASRPANEIEIEEKLGPAGSIGPVGTSVRILKDKAIPVAA